MQHNSLPKASGAQFPASPRQPRHRAVSSTSSSSGLHQLPSPPSQPCRVPACQSATWKFDTGSGRSEGAPWPWCRLHTADRFPTRHTSPGRGSRGQGPAPAGPSAPQAVPSSTGIALQAQSWGLFPGRAGSRAVVLTPMHSCPSPNTTPATGKRRRDTEEAPATQSAGNRSPHGRERTDSALQTSRRTQASGSAVASPCTGLGWAQGSAFLTNAQESLRPRLGPDLQERKAYLVFPLICHEWAALWTGRRGTFDLNLSTRQK